MPAVYRTKDVKVRTAYNWLKATGNLCNKGQSLEAFRKHRKQLVDSWTNRKQNREEYFREQILHAVAASGIPASKGGLDTVASHIFEISWPVGKINLSMPAEIRELQGKINAYHTGLVLGKFVSVTGVGLTFTGKLFDLDLVDDSPAALLGPPNGKDILWMATDSSEPRFAGWLGIDGKSKCELTYLTSIARDLSVLHWKPVMKLANDVMTRHAWKYNVFEMNCKTFAEEFLYQLAGPLVQTPEIEVVGRRSGRERKKTVRFSPF